MLQAWTICRVCRDWPLTTHNLAVEATSQMLRLVWWPVTTVASVTRDHGTMGRWRGGRTNWITLSTWYFLPQPPGRYTGERVIRSITSQYNYGSLSTSICYLNNVCHTYPLAKTISTIKYHAYNVDTRKNINIHFYQHHHHVIYIEQEMMVIFIWDNQL